jgi:hypothetical protein
MTNLDSSALYSLRLPKNIKDLAIKKAQKQGTSLSTIIFHAVYNYVQDETEIRLVPKISKPVEKPQIEIEMDEDEKIVFNALGEKPMSTDELTYKTGLPVQRVIVALGFLTMKNAAKEKGFHSWTLP